jgi:hypothetical protein
MSQNVSDLPFLSGFREHETPFSMRQAGAGEVNDIKRLGLEVPCNNATIYETNPFEFGAWN